MAHSQSDELDRRYAKLTLDPCAVGPAGSTWTVEKPFKMKIPKGMSPDEATRAMDEYSMENLLDNWTPGTRPQVSLHRSKRGRASRISD